MSHPWIVRFDGYAPEHEGHREALCTLGNGYFATRGAAEESRADGMHYPGTYVPFGYNILNSEVAGEVVSNEDLVNLPNWLPVSFRPADGEWFDPSRDEILSWTRELDLKEGVLVRRIRLKDAAGRITAVQSRRLVHSARPHLAALEYRITPENWSGPMEVRSQLDGSVQNTGVARYRQLASRHLRQLGQGPVAPEGIWLYVETTQSRLGVALAARSRLRRDGSDASTGCRIVEEPEGIGQHFTTVAREGETTTLEKVIALYTTQDAGLLAPDLSARLAIEWAPGFDALLKTHRATWAQTWERFDIELIPSAPCEDCDEIQQILRLHIFHLLQTVSESSVGLDVGVPARGLHGEAYRGHIFWDELFIFPFYNLRVPEITRSLLLYRYHRLDAARAIAKEAGARGALFPWQSGSDGREVSQRIHLNPLSGKWEPDHSRLQRHINAAVVYNVWQYWQVSHDRRFLERYGAEMVLEIARAFSDLTTFDPKTRRYEIHGVMGPDEYHEKYPWASEGGLSNNAYTNVMVVWCIDRALELLEILRPERKKELQVLLDLSDEELVRWRDISHRMKVPFHNQGIISQFEGWDRLDELDWDHYRGRHGRVLRLDRILRAEGDSPDHYKASKQADVAMLFYLLSESELERLFERLGYPFDDALIARNVGYYLPRSSHGSTLDLVVHASVVDLLDRDLGWELFGMALRSDVEDIQGGTTAEGIHLGAMAGTVDIVLRHYAGITLTGDVLCIAPRLPDSLLGLRTRVHHRGVWVSLDVRHDGVHLEVEPHAPHSIRVSAYDRPYRLGPGETQWLSPPPKGDLVAEPPSAWTSP
jgi:trehalose/maltose hydrolase-like predicted phosphorylase